MSVLTVKDGDSLMDLAMKVYGSIEGVLNLAHDNNLGITQELAPGQKLTIDSEKVINPLVVNFLSNENG